MLIQGAMLRQCRKVNLGRVALVAVKAILGVQGMKLLHFPVPGHLGQNGGRRNGRHPAIPFTTASAGQAKSGTRLPSTSTPCTSRGKAATARCMASKVAWKILSSSISSGSARPRDQAKA